MLSEGVYPKLKTKALKSDSGALQEGMNEPTNMGAIKKIIEDRKVKK